MLTPYVELCEWVSRVVNMKSELNQLQGGT
jgi:hypothetical protein